MGIRTGSLLLSVLLLGNQGWTTAPEYQLSAQLEAIIEKYQDPAFIEATMKQTAKYADPDFIHRVLHPRESGFEAIDAMNKAVLYQFPYFVKKGKQRIAICGCDVIGLASHALQKYLDQSAMKLCITSLAKTMTTVTMQQSATLIPLLEVKDSKQAAEALVASAWLPINSSTLLRTYLKQRFANACLEYVKKSVTPPSFFIHGKTTTAQEIDKDVAQITPVTSVIPAFAIDGVLDPILNCNMLTRNERFNWDDPYGNRINTLLNINAQYALEGAKQLDWIGTMDEGLLFTIGKEAAISLLFFHRELQEVTTQTLQKHIHLHGDDLKEILMQCAALQKDTTLTPDVRMAREKAILASLESFFKSAQSNRGGEFLGALRQAQCTYNIACTGALLTPALYKIVIFAWKFINALNKPLDGVPS